MRKFLLIFAAIMAYLLLCSKSCDSDEQVNAASKEAEVTKAKEAIKNEFESDELSRKSLRAFEAKAKQKLVDLADYLDIYTDKLIDESFKDQARQMILDLFISDSVLINNRLSGENDEIVLPVREFLKTELASVYTSADFMFDTLEIAAPLRRIDDLNYIGRLSFSRMVKMCNSTDTLIAGPGKLEAEIFVARVKKSFGSDTLLVWKVFLGEIK
jgi:hypothetical protein